eukprot:6401440-Amphidinium_carterae.1
MAASSACDPGIGTAPGGNSRGAAAGPVLLHALVLFVVVASQATVECEGTCNVGATPGGECAWGASSPSGGGNLDTHTQTVLVLLLDVHQVVVLLAVEVALVVEERLSWMRLLSECHLTDLPERRERPQLSETSSFRATAAQCP